jgi:hypothetical protein
VLQFLLDRGCDCSCDTRRRVADANADAAVVEVVFDDAVVNVVGMGDRSNDSTLRIIASASASTSSSSPIATLSSSSFV